MTCQDEVVLNELLDSLKNHAKRVSIGHRLSLVTDTVKNLGKGRAAKSRLTSTHVNADERSLRIANHDRLDNLAYIRDLTHG